MKFAIIYIFKTDNEGYYNEEEDLIADAVVNANLSPEELIESDILDEIFETLEDGTYVKCELYNIDYFGDPNQTEEEVATLISDQLETLINKSLVNYTDYTVFEAVVKRDDASGLTREG